MKNCLLLLTFFFSLVDSSNAQSELVDRKWILTELKGKPVSDYGMQAREAYLLLTSKDQRVNGTGGCNNFMGTFSTGKKGKIQFSKMVSTMMACMNMTLESDLMKELESITNYIIKENSLELINADKRVIAKLSSKQILPEITNKYWKLIELNGTTLTSIDKQRSEPHINLHVEGNRITGSGGCNNFTGSYELMEGNRVLFSQIASTKMACMDMTNEDALLKILNIADNYVVNGDSLILNKARMAPLARFVAVYMK